VPDKGTTSSGWCPIILAAMMSALCWSKPTAEPPARRLFTFRGA
jgi:hypothetical protein